MDKTAYEIFGRDDHDSPIRRLGSIRAESTEVAQSITWHTFDGFRRVEMWIVPREAVTVVDASSGAMEEGILEEDTRTLEGDPTSRRDIDV